MTHTRHTSTPGRTLTRVLLGGLLITAGIGHFTFARKEFQAQVPETVTQALRVSKDQVVLASGAVEVALGTALLFSRKRRRIVGKTAAALFIAVFPGNVAQWVHRRDAFTLDTDGKRFARLWGQPLLAAAALWSTREPRHHELQND